MKRLFFVVYLGIIFFASFASCSNQLTTQPVQPLVQPTVNLPATENLIAVTPSSLAKVPTPGVVETPVLPQSPAPMTTQTPKVVKYNGYGIIKDVQYGDGGGIPLLLDVYIPDKRITFPTPAVIFIHGGGWSGGDKFPCQVNVLAQNGFLCISINYRLSGVAQFPAAVEDCKCSVRWLKAHAAEYNVDPNKIGVWGGSAGGHLALMVGLVDSSAGLEGTGGWAEYSSRVQAVCSYYGTSDMAKQCIIGNREMPSAFIGGRPSEKPELFAQASPINYVSRDDPPLLMVHGDKDVVVPYEQSKMLLEAYQKAGLDVKLVTVQNAGHSFQQAGDQPISPDIKQIQNEALSFFIKNLVNGK
jgi:acetyl esterase/lipase